MHCRCTYCWGIKKTPPVNEFLKYVTEIEQGSILTRDDLIKQLAHMGYERAEIVEAQGQFAVRGDIVDIFTPGSEDPYRVEFFDTEVDSIRVFDAQTQRSKGNSRTQTIYPAQLVIKDEKRFKYALENIVRTYKSAEAKYKDEETLHRLKAKRLSD